MRTPFFNFEYSRQESNLRLLPPEGSALSTELREHKNLSHDTKSPYRGTIVTLLILTGSTGRSPSLG